MSTKRLLSVSLALFPLLSACTLVDQRNAIEVRGVQASVDDGTSAEVDEPSGIGVAILGMLDPLAYLPVAFEIGVQQLVDNGVISGVEQDLAQNAAWVGVRAEFLTGHWRPHIGTGFMFVDGEVERGIAGVVTDTDEFSSPGLYLELGSRIRMSNTFHIGLGVRQTFLLEDEIDGVDTEFDFAEVYATLGLTF